MTRGDQLQAICPICKQVEFRRRFIKKGRTFYRCLRCGLEKQHPLPTAAALKEYYEESYAAGMYRTFAAAQQMKLLTAQARLRQLEGIVPLHGKWLDVGCANGVLVQAARERGIDAEGVELSANAVAEALKANIPVRAGTLADIHASQTYDCITAFDVLEHVIDPVEFLAQVVERLKPGGSAVITVPNRRSWPARLMGSRWYFYIPEEHLHYFDPTTLRSLASSFALKTTVTRPTYKPLTFDYALTQFAEYNPVIFRLMSVAGWLLPKAMRSAVVPLYIGEVMLVAQKPLEPLWAETSVDRSAVLAG